MTLEDFVRMVKQLAEQGATVTCRTTTYLLAKIGADTAENEQHFVEILPIGRRVADHGRSPHGSSSSDRLWLFSSSTCPLAGTLRTADFANCIRSHHLFALRSIILGTRR